MLKVVTPNNEELDIKCESLVNAAGPWAGELMQKINIHLPVTPRKRYVFSFDCPKGPGRSAPLAVDPSGVYFKPDGPTGTRYLCGCSPGEVCKKDYYRFVGCFLQIIFSEIL